MQNLVCPVTEPHAFDLSLGLDLLELLQNLFNFIHHSNSTLFDLVAQQRVAKYPYFVVVLSHGFDGINHIVLPDAAREPREYHEGFLVVALGRRDISPLYHRGGALE